MALPKIDLPIFELTLPSTGKKVKYRPFTVKEEKILLVAQESHDAKQEIMAVKQVVNNCLVDLEASDLPMFDLEYIMLMLRSKSVDNKIEFQIKDPDTEEDVTLSLDIEDVSLTVSEEAVKEIKINDDYMLMLRYPSIDDYATLTEVDNADPLINYLLMVSCLDKIASEDEVFDFKNYTEKEIFAFVDDLSSEVIKGIQTFFETMPKLRHEMKYSNSNGDEKTFVVEGMRSFFI